MPGGKSFAQEWAGLVMPTLAAAEAGALFMRQAAAVFAAPVPPPAPEPLWASPNEIVLNLHAARLRRFGPKVKPGAAPPAATPLLVCAPFSVHGAQIADLCAGHSLMQALAAHRAPLYLVEWLSARPDQAGRRIDDLLSDLNIFFDELGGAADFVGLCQGGWLGLIYAARFPGRIGRLAIAGAPVDIEAAPSPLSLLAQSTSLNTFRELVALGNGLALGAKADRLWRPLPESPEDIHGVLQSDLAGDSPQFLARVEAFHRWGARTLDLPGAYYLEVAERFYKANALARGEFVALGKRIDLRALRNPLFLLAAAEDEIAAPAQTMACADLVGTPSGHIVRHMAEGGHLSLFVGARNLRRAWADVVGWLDAPQRRPAQNA
ncbi:poly(3-hydroxyalkanoate) synthetase [Rhodoblastus acidophilus]|uniref:alpha/beta fold hydrolase n=1 Tax=Rhodoblastus acidophilus TaxID=1074 RepID=UPI002225961F|nr:alpha/beta fold hydrolase [Rhodoblastus acidophilus]MCW2314932.1 poly(3-hydroxyalkanoate) synthetase [Rhodoblastus acidophilus]